MSHKFFDLTFTDAVKAAQTKYGSRRSYARFEDGGPSDFDGLGDAEADFIEARDGFYMATVNPGGQPYIQFRGGPRGFLRLVDDRTLGFADFRGNLQYISVGNLADNPKVALFLMDYATQTRLKILATAEVRDVRGDAELAARFAVEGYQARVERVVLLHVEAFDWNCPQHITPRYKMDEIRAMTAPMTAEIERLEREVEALKAKLEETKLNEQPKPTDIKPPFDLEKALAKVKAAENAWNSRDPERVALAYSEDSAWRNRTDFINGRDEIKRFLHRKWERELDYRLKKELWGFRGNRMAVKFEYEWHDADGNWFRSYGNELWEFDDEGLMRRREASINDAPIDESERRVF